MWQGSCSLSCHRTDVADEKELKIDTIRDPLEKISFENRFIRRTSWLYSFFLSSYSHTERLSSPENIPYLVFFKSAHQLNRSSEKKKSPLETKEKWAMVN